MLNQSVQPIDVEYSEVADPSSTNLVSFPATSAQPAQPRQPRKRLHRNPKEVAVQPKYTATQLAEVAQVTRQAWSKDWFRHFMNLVPENELRTGSKYTQLCHDLTTSLAENRASGMSTAAWMRYIAIPKWGQQRQEQEEVVAASEAVAIVPSSVGDAQSAQALTLTRAQNLQGFAGALLDRLSEHLAATNADATATNDAIADAAIVADEMAKILKEQQLRAKIRADFEAKQQAAAAATLEQRLDGLKGGVQ